MALIGVGRRKQIGVVSREQDDQQHHTQADARYLKWKRSNGATSTLRLEAKESERASSSKSASYSQGCKVSSQQSVTRINLNTRHFYSITTVQDRKGMSRSPTDEDRSEPQDQGLR